MILKQSTVYFRKFLMVLSSDHISGATGKTVTIRLNKGPTAGGTTAAGAIIELDSTNNPGVYQIALTTADTGVAGDLWYTCTASGCDNTDFVDQVQPSIFTDLTLDATGNVSITSNLKKNTAHPNFSFLMTDNVNHKPITGLGGITGARSIDGGGFSNLTNSVTEIANGWYVVSLTAAETNGNFIALRFSATGADDLDLGFPTAP